MRAQRTDIQSLRAIAVVLVIADHLIGRPSGGFVGVDVFFVISGFLITGLLLREQARTGRISFTAFYRRRVKRLLPAAAVVTAVTVAAALAIMPLVRAGQVVVDALWASVFLANWRFVALGTDYMHATDSLSPLQHYWSLAVEEQFYVVWPLLIVATLALGRRLHSPRRALVLVLAVVTVASFGWSLWESAARPTSAYFSTASRGWELGVGALLAFASPHLGRLPQRLRPVLAWAGIAVIAASALLVDQATTVPAPGVLAAVLATAVVIAAGTATERAPLTPLSNPVAVYVGTVSYSLYLWHLPVIVFVGLLLPERGTRYVVISVALIAVLSVLSYHWVETPLRQRPWRILGEGRMPRPSRLAGGPVALRRAALAVLLVSVVGLGLATASSHVAVARPRVDVGALLVGAPSDPARASAVEAALTAPSWPELHPDVTQLGDASRAPEWLDDGCLGLEQRNDLSPEDNALRCVYGDPEAPRTIAILGDSVAISYVPALREAAGDSWRVEVYTMAECPAIDLDTRLGNGESDPRCGSFRDWAVGHLADERPDRVVLTTTPRSLTRLSSGATGEAALDEWRDATGRTLTSLEGLDVTVLDPPPDGQSLAACALRWSVPADCLGGPDELFVATGAATRATAADHPDVTVPPTLAWFCDTDGACPAFVEGVPVSSDGLHLTAAASRQLGPLVRDALRLD
jgi:peptidoglycan/LPS O-acetylase OafA/YrhL